MRFLHNVVKVLWAYSWSSFFTVVMFIPVFLTSLFSSTGNTAFNFSKIWGWLMLKGAFATVKIRNKEIIKPGQSYIIVANHQSSLDIPAILTTLGIQFRWTVKKSLMWVPFFGYAIYISKNIFIDRSNKEKAIRSINKGVERLPKGASIIFFVEGSRSKDETLGKFKKGAFVTAIQNEFPILTVTVNGSGKLMPKKSMAFRSGTVEVVVGGPIETKDYSLEDIDELMEKTRNMISEDLNFDYPAERSRLKER